MKETRQEYMYLRRIVCLRQKVTSSFGCRKDWRWIGVGTICRRIIVRSYILHTSIRALTEACSIGVLAVNGISTIFS